MDSNNQTKRNPIYDLSFWFLLLSNLIAIYIAITTKLSLINILWIYWAQSITIGFFSYIRIKKFAKVSNGASSPLHSKNNLNFAVTFGFYNFIYFVFLLVFSLTSETTISEIYDGPVDISSLRHILIPVVIFFFNHLFSYYYNKRNDSNNKNVSSLYGIAFSRLLPMHLILFFSFLFKDIILLFLLLKTASDLSMHNYEHNSLSDHKQV